MLLQKVSQTIIQAQLLPSVQNCGRPVLVALSGGADSVALLRALLALGYRCEAAHCNFQLRGEESERDELFVHNLCEKLNVRLHLTHFNTRQYAEENHISLEMAARDLRYNFFLQVLEKEELACVAVAHHRDDNVETILLNLVRGTGLQGLTGMARKRDNIIRPLLDVSREEILAYLKELQQDFVVDSTNLETDVKRNVIRLKVLPILKELNPSVCETIQRNASNLAEAQQFVEQQVDKVQKTTREDGATIINKDQIPNHLLLFYLLNPMGFTPSQIDDIWQRLNDTPGAIYKSNSHELLRDRDSLIIRCVEPETERDEMPLPLDTPITLCGQTVIASLVSENEIGTLLTNPDYAFLDADKAGTDLHLRKVKNADRFTPFGMKGSKLVSQYMKDHKYDAFQKQSQLVVANSQGIIWLVGQRIDNRYRITPTSTTRILRLQILK